MTGHPQGHIAKYVASMTPERILQLAQRPDGFRVHRFRHRDANIAARCKRLMNEGKLKRAYRTREETVWMITDIGRAAISTGAA